MIKRIVAFIPKGKDHREFFDDYYIYGCGYPDQDFYKKSKNIKYRFEKAWFFSNDKSNEYNSSQLKKYAEKYHDKQTVKENISPEYENDFFVTYNDGRIVNIETVRFFNEKGIMDGYNVDDFSSGIFTFRGKIIALNIENYILKFKKEETKKFLMEKYKISEFINTDDLLTKTDDFSESLFHELYNKRTELLYHSFLTKKFFEHIRKQELKNIPAQMFQYQFYDHNEMNKKYGENGRENYIKQPLIICMKNLKNEGKVSYGISRYLGFIHLFGDKKYMELFKYMFITTYEYIYNGKIIKIEENMKIEDPRKRLKDYQRQVRNYYKRMKRSVKQRNKVVCITAHC